MIVPECTSCFSRMVDTKADWVQATTVTSANNLQARLVSNENTHTNLLPHTDAAFRKSGYDLAGHWQSLNSSTRGMLGHAAFTQETENVRTGRRTLYQLFRVSEHRASSPFAWDYFIRTRHSRRPTGMGSDKPSSPVFIRPTFSSRNRLNLNRVNRTDLGP